MDELAALTLKHGQLFGWIAAPDQDHLIQFLPKMAQEFSQPLRIVEVGVFAGSTTRGLTILTGGFVTGIDNWRDVHPESGCHGVNKQEELFWHVLKDHGTDVSKQAKLIVGNSQEVGRHWNEPIDLLFIDGDHSYDGALADIQLFMPHVVKNGYCLIDDYDMADVRRAVADGISLLAWDVLRIPDITGTTGKILVLKRHA